jgi:hypothetical protein
MEGFMVLVFKSHSKKVIIYKPRKSLGRTWVLHKLKKLEY